MTLDHFHFELKKYPLHYLFLALVLALAFFARSFRTHDLLRFYYDQGRDALIIKEMIETPKPVLVGPTTGLAGILRGPAFYYLLAPAYLVGGGSPVAAALWLQVLNLVGLIFIYLTARILFGRMAGIFAVLLMGFSNGVVDLSRWLSNPAPILLSVPLMVYGLVKIKKQIRPDFWWLVVALCLGINLQFEIASEIWFLPAILLLILLDRQMRPKLKTAILGLLIFGATLLPQIFFDIRHDGILREGIAQNFASSTTPAFAYQKEAFVDRLSQYVDIYANILVQRQHDLVKILVVLIGILLYFPAFRKNSFLLLVLLLTPLFILAFYQGNYGNFYSYYLIGTFPIFLLLLAGAFSWFWRHPALRLIPVLFLVYFLYQNGVLVKNFLAAGADGIIGEENITLQNQYLALDWIYKDAKGKPFNVDVYVPPVIPYAYDYLFPWYGQKHYGQIPSLERQNLLYTLYEVDPPQPGRLAAWLLRQAGIGEVQEEQRYGGIVVQRRLRK